MENAASQWSGIHQEAARAERAAAKSRETLQFAVHTLAAPGLSHAEIADRLDLTETLIREFLF